MIVEVCRLAGSDTWASCPHIRSFVVVSGEYMNHTGLQVQHCKFLSGWASLRLHILEIKNGAYKYIYIRGG